jgi:hypothetical protein
MPLTKIQSLGITDGTIVNADINASAAIAGTKISGSFGKVLQVVSTTKTNTFTTSSTSYVDITDLSQAITPTSSSSKILVMMTLTFGNSTATVFQPCRLMRGATAIYIGDAEGSRTRGSGGSGRVNDVSDTYSINFNFLDSPATTSSTTYKVQTFSNGGTVFIGSNGLNANNSETGRYPSTITLMEIGV